MLGRDRASLTLSFPSNAAVRGVLTSHPETYEEIRAVHFAKHSETLQAGLRRA